METLVRQAHKLSVITPKERKQVASFNLTADQSLLSFYAKSCSYSRLNLKICRFKAIKQSKGCLSFYL